MHVEGLGVFFTYLSFKNIVGSGIVGFKRHAREGLFVSHFFKKGSDDWDSFLAVEKKTTSFSFGSGGRNAAKSFAKNTDHTIWFGIRRRGSWEITEKVDASTAAASIGKYKISSIGYYTEDHVAGIITDGGVRMCGKIIEKHITSFAGEDSGLCLIIGDTMMVGSTARA